ncbi:hypothetical protein V5O48_010576 [Marasmius crinis-equi]|uniref:SH3 domain-containing protein n=1 Tax=Marasmius crinis-equi TaxID=585013 RepID=A0ABR3F7Z5_9AGAR
MTVTVLSFDNEKAALLAHVVEQIEKNIDFLVSEDYLPESQASSILSTLSNVNCERFDRVTTRRAASMLPIRRPSGGVPTPFINAPPSPPREDTGIPSPPLPPRSAPATLSSILPTCRAIWGYNEKEANPDELSFAAGDIIEIVEETTTDWWTGRVSGGTTGREGLFPSSYVDKIEVGVAAGRPPPPKRVMPARPNRYSNVRVRQTQ